MRTRQPQKQRNVRSYTASATLTPGSFEGYHDNRGAEGAVALTLPTPAAVKGMRAWFNRVADQSVTLEPPGTETFQEADGGASAAGKYMALATHGAALELSSDGTRYVILATRGTITEEA